MPAACKVLRECQPLSAASPSLLPSPPLPAPQTPTTRGWARCTTSTTSTAWRCSPSRATRHAHAHAACAALRCAQALPCVRRLAGAAAWPAMRDPALPALSQSGLLQPDRAASLHPASAHTAATPSPLRVHPQFGEQEPASMPEIESFLGRTVRTQVPALPKSGGQRRGPAPHFQVAQGAGAAGRRQAGHSSGLHSSRHGRRRRQQTAKRRPARLQARQAPTTTSGQAQAGGVQHVHMGRQQGSAGASLAGVQGWSACLRPPPLPPCVHPYHFLQGRCRGQTLPGTSR